MMPTFPAMTPGFNGADSDGGVSTAIGAGTTPPSISPAGTVTTPGTYGEHPTPPSEVASIPAPDTMHLFHSRLERVEGLLAHMDADLHSMRPQADVFKIIYLSSAPVRLDRFDRGHSRILVGANVAVNIDTGIGNITMNLVAGWNVLDFPDGAYISTAATAANALYVCSDHGLN